MFINKSVTAILLLSLMNNSVEGMLSNLVKSKLLLCSKKTRTLSTKSDNSLASHKLNTSISKCHDGKLNIFKPNQNTYEYMSRKSGFDFFREAGPAEYVGFPFLHKTFIDKHVVDKNIIYTFESEEGKTPTIYSKEIKSNTNKSLDLTVLIKSLNSNLTSAIRTSIKLALKLDGQNVFHPFSSLEELYNKLPDTLKPHYAKMISHLAMEEDINFNEYIINSQFIWLGEQRKNNAGEIIYSSGYRTDIHCNASLLRRCTNKFKQYIRQQKELVALDIKSGFEKDCKFLTLKSEINPYDLLGINSNANFYTVLGVSENVSEKELRLAYHNLAFKWHPDINNSRGADKVFALINEAYRSIKPK